MGKSTDIRCTGAALYFLPVETRVPLKFGVETLTSVTCARVRMSVESRDGDVSEGWGETPLSVTWVWPGTLPYEERHQAMKSFCELLARSWAHFSSEGHPLEIGHDFMASELPALLKSFNLSREGSEMPWLAALVCCSLFDIAVHDAYGNLHGKSIYDLYGSEYLNRDLSCFLKASAGEPVSFEGSYPDAFLKTPEQSLPAWHLVGGLDPVGLDELTGDEPEDGYPVELSDWIRRDGLKCLKVKLRGNDSEWDYERTVKVGNIARALGVTSLSTDFNCTVTDPAYVSDILDRLKRDHLALYEMLLYVEQPFPYELEEYPIDVHEVSSRRPLFLDESAHDWKLVRLGRELGWTGVALKTCKTQTGALLSCCWAKAHRMGLMVQDLTNPMLAQIPHVLLAAHVGTIMGVETNAMQFYPEASLAEAKVHPGLYRRKDGKLNLASVRGSGFGYRLEEISRELPAPSAQH
jgi:L-alanine-DL-glutamate epimerase-like enolase superfamily enzyme